jgi:type II secretory pathway pseudopilin PulG
VSHALNPRRLGYTIVEMVISLGLLGGLLGGLALVLQQASNSYASSSERMALDVRGGHAVRRIANALRHVDTASIQVVPAPPFSASRIDFRVSQGYSGQQSTWSPPRSIALDPGPGRVVWTDNVTLPSQTSSNWCSGVTALLEGETLNGLDDNGNGLIDEPGLSFSRQGSLLTVLLTLQFPGAGGAPLQRTWTTVVRCRN